MPLNPYISILTVDDIPHLEKIELQTRLSFWGNENYQKFLSELPEYFGAKAIIPDSQNESLVAGFFLARSLYENLEILKVGVLPEYQAQGIGTLLMDHAYAEGVRRGCGRCFLEVRKSNRNAIQFYHTHKFQIAGTRINYYTDPVEDAWIMERNL